MSDLLAGRRTPERLPGTDASTDVGKDVGGDSGKETVKVEPWPGSESTETVPPWPSAIARTIDSPRPDPWIDDHAHEEHVRAPVAPGREQERDGEPRRRPPHRDRRTWRREAHGGCAEDEDPEEREQGQEPPAGEGSPRHSTTPDVADRCLSRVAVRWAVMDQ